jgi:hypothetical protein
MSNKAESWFASAIASGIQRLMVLGLDGTPAASTIELTTVTWIDALWAGRVWDAKLDETRIAEAFRLLTIQAERWPAPVQFLRMLPDRHGTQPKLGRKMTKEEIRGGLEVLARLKRELNK